MNHSRDAFRHKRELDPQANQKPITISQCGFYTAHNKEFHFTEVVEDKNVTQCLLVYQHKGNATIFTETKKIPVKEGTVMIFPTSATRRILYGKDQTNERYYLYLQGTHISDYLSQFGFSLNTAVYNIGCSNTLQNYFLALLDDFRIHNFSTDVHRITLFFKILEHINKKLQAPITSNMNQEELQIIVDYIEKNYQTNISLDDCAKVAHISVPKLIRLFKEYLHLTPHNYISNIRLTNAQFLLQTSNLTVSEIALQVGFEDSLYFCKFFKKQTGVSPTEYRKLSGE